MPFVLKDHLKALSECHAPSGYETAAREVVQAAWQPLVDEIETSRLGSLVGIKRGESTTRRKIMLAAHTDEIGAVVTRLEGAFLRITSLNGLDHRNVLGKAVMLHTQSGLLPGVIGVRPRFVVGSLDEFPKWEEMFVDLGLSAAEVAAKVRPGDVITMDASMLTLQGERVAGKAFDDRACVAAITVCLEALKSRRHRWDVYAVATVQEEFALEGARGEAFRLQPDIGIALDVTFAPQSGVSGPTFDVGEGVPLGIGANFHPALVEAIQKAAERLEMDLPLEPTPMHSGTDAWEIQASRDGVPTALLSVPVRNMHSTIETADLRDIERAGRLLAEFIAGLEDDFLSTMVWEKEQEAATA